MLSLVAFLYTIVMYNVGDATDSVAHQASEEQS